MKTISVKLFMVLLLLGVFGSFGIIFNKFYEESKTTIASLLEDNIQANILNLKHFLDKNLKPDNIHQLTAYLDNHINASAAIADLHILTPNEQILYATDRDKTPRHQNIKCTPISKIINSNIFQQNCYSFKVKVFDHFKPYYYETDLYINKEYLNSLAKDQAKKYTILFLVSSTLFLLIIWFLVQNILVHPLEKLRQFAYYQNTIPPKEFFLQELESIRYSLKITFERLQQEQKKLFNLSTKDSLSGLYNRLSLMEKIHWLIAKSRREKEQFALLFLDLDNFKNVNDTEGHNIGDKILQKIAEILLMCVRKDDIVARLGGDEFVIILPSLKHNANILEVIHRIQKELATPVDVGKKNFTITASIGITIYPKDGEDATTLLKHADIAMYKAKALGKNNYYFFTENLNVEIHKKLQMQNLLQNALKEGYFKLFYQPKVNIKTGKIVGCEALIRLFDPKNGMIPPDTFIPLAEESGLIVPIGEWIISEAVNQLQKWQNTPLKDLRLSINLSAVQLKDDDFIAYLSQSIGPVAKERLDIELTESVLMDHFDKSLEKIHTIKSLGLSLSLDDFGTGFSSLSYLKKIPFDTLKIDKSFVDDLEKEKEKSFVNMIVNIAHNLKMEVVAEGVETQEQLDYLASIGCELYQGYYCSKPLPAEEFEELFKNGECS